MGVAPRLLQAIAEAGPVDGLQAAREIIAAGSAASFNKLDKGLNQGGLAIGAFVVVLADTAVLVAWRFVAGLVDPAAAAKDVTPPKQDAAPPEPAAEQGRADVADDGFDFRQLGHRAGI